MSRKESSLRNSEEDENDEVEIVTSSDSQPLSKRRKTFSSSSSSSSQYSPPQTSFVSPEDFELPDQFDSPPTRRAHSWNPSSSRSSFTPSSSSSSSSPSSRSSFTPSSSSSRYPSTPSSSSSRSSSTPSSSSHSSSTPLSLPVPNTAQLSFAIPKTRRLPSSFRSNQDTENETVDLTGPSPSPSPSGTPIRESEKGNDQPSVNNQNQSEASQNPPAFTSSSFPEGRSYRARGPASFSSFSSTARPSSSSTVASFRNLASRNQERSEKGNSTQDEPVREESASEEPRESEDQLTSDEALARQLQEREFLHQRLQNALGRMPLRLPPVNVHFGEDPNAPNFDQPPQYNPAQNVFFSILNRLPWMQNLAAGHHQHHRGGHRHHHNHGFHNTALPANPTPQQLMHLDRDFTADDYEMLLKLDEGLPNYKAADESEINHIPVIKATGTEGSCCICLTDFEAGEDLKQLVCSHVFHPECIDQWLKVNHVCPIDQQPVVAKCEREEIPTSQPTRSRRKRSSASSSSSSSRKRRRTSRSRSRSSANHNDDDEEDGNYQPPVNENEEEELAEEFAEVEDIPEEEAEPAEEPARSSSRKRSSRHSSKRSKKEK